MRPPASPFARDCLWAAALTTITQLELVLAASEIDDRVLQHLVFVPMTGSIALRRRLPLAAAAICGIAMAAQTLVGEAPVVGGFLAMLVVLFSLGFHASLKTGLLGVAAVGFGALLYDLVTDEFRVGDLVANAVIVVGTWALAFAVRRSTDARVAAEIEGERAAREATTAERNRIARDLHDSVAHTLTLMTLQAGAARERTEERVAAEALATIENGGRQALVDMHRFLRMLDEVARPGRAPGLQDLDDLVARMSAGGFVADVATSGDLESLPASVSSTAYRVVQEGLTNAAKHSGAAAAHVAIRLENDTVRVEVNDAGRTYARGRGLALGSGRGLAALRDRLALFEGTLTAAPDDHGWSLTAVIPLRPTA